MPLCSGREVAQLIAHGQTSGNLGRLFLYLKRILSKIRLSLPKATARSGLQALEALPPTPVPTTPEPLSFWLVLLLPPWGPHWDLHPLHCQLCPDGPVPAGMHCTWGLLRKGSCCHPPGVACSVQAPCWGPTPRTSVMCASFSEHGMGLMGAHQSMPERWPGKLPGGQMRLLMPELRAPPTPLELAAEDRGEEHLGQSTQE